MRPAASPAGGPAGEGRAPLPSGQEEAAARSLMYALLAAWLHFPRPEFHRDARSGAVAEEAAAALRGLPFGVAGAEECLAGLAAAVPDYDDFQASYVGLFDVGAGGPPCPLYGGEWGGERQQAMEDALRFFRFFGLTLSTEEAGRPDQLSTQLEFLHYLTFRERAAAASGGDTGGLRRACRDFLERHPARWLPRAADRLAALDAPAFWRGLVSLAASYCAADAAALVASEGPAAR